MQLEMTRVWENSPERVSKEMEGKERRVGREGTRERDLAREGKERSIHPETLKKCRGGKKKSVERQRQRVGRRWNGKFRLPGRGAKRRDGRGG